METFFGLNLDDTYGTLRTFGISLGIIILFYFLANTLQKLLKKRLLKRMNDLLLANFISVVFRLIVILVGFMIVFRFLGLSGVVTGVLTGAGISAFIIGFALKASKKEKHKFVKVITHHSANDNAGDFYKWQDILDFGIEEVRIPDQNINLKVKKSDWDWAMNHTDDRIQFVWLMGKMAEIDNVVKFQKGYWDCSDAGMVLYWITGATAGGLKEGKVDDFKTLLIKYLERY